jgi:hypothetical protein
LALELDALELAFAALDAPLELVLSMQEMGVVLAVKSCPHSDIKENKRNLAAVALFLLLLALALLRRNAYAERNRIGIICSPGVRICDARDLCEICAAPEPIIHH